MKNVNYKLVATDLDNTLVGRDKVMSDFSKAVLTKIHNKGIHIGIASGRPVFMIKPFFSRWNLPFEFDFVIGLNGGQLYDNHTHKIEEFYKLKKEDCKEIINFMKKYDNNLYTYTENTELTERLDEIMLRNIELGVNVCPDVIANDVSEFYNRDTFKLLFRFNSKLELDKAIDEYNREKLPFYFVKSQEKLIEFMDKRNSKGIALKKYCNIHNIPIEATIGCGDAENDEDMLLASGLSICLCNGSEELKKKCDIVTELPYDKDGLAFELNKVLNLTL